MDLGVSLEILIQNYHYKMFLMTDIRNIQIHIIEKFKLL